MKLELMKDRLKEAVTSAEKITSKNSSLAILNNVVLEALGSVLSVKATNLETGIEIQIPAKIEVEGTIAVNGQVLVSFLSNLYNEDKVTIELVDGNLFVSTKKGSTLVKCVLADDFPSIPRVDDGFTLAMTADNLIGSIKSVVYAAAVSDIKPEIASVYIYTDQSKMVFVATDSFRLAEKKINLNGGIKGEFSPIIIPLKNALEIVRIFDGSSEMINLQANKHQLSLYTPVIHFTSRLIDSIFPDYRQIMPTGHLTEITLKKIDLVNALKLANVFSDRLNQVDVRVVPADSLFEINSRNQDVGENTVKVAGEITGEEVSMSFNVKYVLDCFQSLSAEQITLLFNGAQKPMVVTGNNNFIYLVMPVRR